MIEITIRDYLAETLQIPVHMEIPTNAPTRFIVLKRSGEGRKNLVEDALLITDSYAESLLEAAKLNELVKLAVENMDELDEISSVRLSTDYPVIDTGNKRYRYQAVFEINHY